LNDAGRQDRTTPLGEALQQYLNSQRAFEVTCEHVIPAIWPEVVGQWYAVHTRVVRVWEGIVEVQCDSAARAQQLQLDSPEIIRRLNQRLGMDYVRQIRPGTAQRPTGLRPAAVKSHTRPPIPTEEELEAIELSEHEEKMIAEQAEKIADEAAREAYVRAARTHLKLRRWKLARGWRECPNCGELYDPCGGCPCRSR